MVVKDNGTVCLYCFVRAMQCRLLLTSVGLHWDDEEFRKLVFPAEVTGRTRRTSPRSSTKSRPRPARKKNGRSGNRARCGKSPRRASPKRLKVDEEDSEEGSEEDSKEDSQGKDVMLAQMKSLRRSNTSLQGAVTKGRAERDKLKSKIQKQVEVIATLKNSIQKSKRAQTQVLVFSMLSTHSILYTSYYYYTYF